MASGGIDPLENIPLADEDGEIEQSTSKSKLSRFQLNTDGSIESAESSLATGQENSSAEQSLDLDLNPDEKEEKERLVQQVLELQATLDDLSRRVDGVREENTKLGSENQVLGQYINNLMNASSVFQATAGAQGKKGKK